MSVFLNGQFVPEDQAVVSVFDRGFMYGDGLFETLRVLNAKPFRWEAHLERLQRGAEFLKISLPFTPGSLRGFAARLIEENRAPDSILRLQLSRGIGPRGYSPRGAGKPSLVMSLHPAPPRDPNAPPRWRLVISAIRLPVDDAAAAFKTSNKLAQILARAQADAAGADEALLLNAHGQVTTASSGNLFWIHNDEVCTPPLASGILPGVTRTVLLEVCRDLSLPTREISLLPEQLLQTQGVFLSSSAVGVAECQSLDGQPLGQSPLTNRLSASYWASIEKETR